MNKYKTKTRLQEERGVAAFKYRDVIDEIFQYVKRMLLIYHDCWGELKIDDTIPYVIPDEISNKLDFIEKATIKVFVKIIKSHDDVEYADAETEYDGDTQITSDTHKLHSADITINAFGSTDGILYEDEFFDSIYHELNHTYDAYKQLTSKDAMDNYDKDKKFRLRAAFSDELEQAPTLIHIPMFNSDLSIHCKDFGGDIARYVYANFGVKQIALDIGNCFYKIMYMLMSSTERNAFASGVYGSLESMHSTRNNFREDCKKTDTYKLYTELTTKLQKLNKYRKSGILNDSVVLYVKNLLKSYGVRISRSNSADGFWMSFNNYIEGRLNDLLGRIYKVASLYYDTMEEKAHNDKTVKEFIERFKDLI